MSIQGTRRQDPLQPVHLRASVTNAQGNVVGSESALLSVRDFSTERAANHYLALPLATLATGEYLIRIETGLGARRRPGDAFQREVIERSAHTHPYPLGRT